MKALILSIGDELLIGQTVNTNASYIADKLTEAGAEVNKVVTVGDELDEIVAEIKDGIKNYDIVVATGGLGPTHDDITREAVLKAFETKLVLSESVLEDIRERFRKYNRQMSPVNESQAMVPEIAEVIRNEAGTAPGFWIEQNNKYFACMPGVPHEMKLMIDNFIIPKVRSVKKPGALVSKRLNLLTTGIPESTLYQRLLPLEEIIEDAKLAFLPNVYGVKMRITAAGSNDAEAEEKLIRIEQRMRSVVGRFIYSRAEEDLSVVVGRLLKERTMTISVAESCTGGLICDEITNISGSSKYFERGIIAYSNAAKVEILHVDEDLIAAKGAVSEECCAEMAKGVRAISGTDIGLSITGILGPTGATTTKPVGLTYIGIADSEKVIVKKFNFADNRINNKKRATHAALELVRRFLLGIQIEP